MNIHGPVYPIKKTFSDNFMFTILSYQQATHDDLFEDKKQRYFLSKDGISPFALTTQVLGYREWKPTTIEQRQSQLITALKQLWRL